jgi:hypothetical protein
MKGLLACHGDAIEQAVFWNSVDLCKLDVDLVVYDATKAWFETDEADVASHQWRGLPDAMFTVNGSSPRLEGLGGSRTARPGSLGGYGQSWCTGLRRRLAPRRLERLRHRGI